MNKFSATLLAASMVLTGASTFAQGSAAPGSKPGAFGAKEPANSSAIGERPAKVATPKTKRTRAASGNPAPNLAEQKAGAMGAKESRNSSSTAENPMKAREPMPMGATTGASTNTVNSKAGAYGAKEGRNSQDTGVMPQKAMKQ